MDDYEKGHQEHIANEMVDLVLTTVPEKDSGWRGSAVEAIKRELADAYRRGARDMRLKTEKLMKEVQDV